MLQSSQNCNSFVTVALCVAVFYALLTLIPTTTIKHELHKAIEIDIYLQ
jgi:hypothetical protein